jgi:hypothetical protein
MSWCKKFPAQTGRAGAPENGAIALDLDTERPMSSESNIYSSCFSDVFLLASTPLNWSVSCWQGAPNLATPLLFKVHFG